ncbi:MAG: hypothetical protein H0W88_09690 [Parachlamydiaceae bacterium]|nr:hypothetical protein [Parachlamydiaceae bacterium]
MISLNNSIGPKYQDLIGKKNLSLTSSTQEVTKVKKGSNIVLSRLETLVQVSILMKQAADNGASWICSATTIFSGLGHFAAGNLITGTVLTGAGVVNLTKSLGSGGASSAVDLIKDAKAGVEMVQILEGQNIESLHIVEKNLEVIKEHVKDLSTKLKAVHKIATTSDINVNAQKLIAAQAYDDADVFFKDALALFKDSKRNRNDASKTLKRSQRRFEKLFEAANNKKGNIKTRLDNFIELTREIYEENKEAQDSLDESEKHFSFAFTLLNKAIMKKEEAAAESAKALEMSQNSIKRIAEITEMNQENQRKEAVYNTNMQEASSHVGQVLKRTDQARGLLIDVTHDLNEAQKNVGYTLGEVALCGGAGAVIGAAAMGAMAAAPGVLAGLAAKSIYNTATAHNYYASQEECANMAEVETKFYPWSTGFFGKIRGRQSWTAGEVFVKVGPKRIRLTFNLDARKNQKIPKRDVQVLYQNLMSGLDNKSLTPLECLNIIRQLRTRTINRDPAGKKTSTGLVPEDCVYLKDLEQKSQGLLLQQNMNQAIAEKNTKASD